MDAWLFLGAIRLVVLAEVVVLCAELDLIQSRRGSTVDLLW